MAIACGCTLANVNAADFDDGVQVVLHSCWTEPVFWLKDNLFSVGIFDFDNMTTQVENFNFQNDFPPFLCCFIVAQTRLVE